MTPTVGQLDERIATLASEIAGLDRRADDLALEQLSIRSATGHIRLAEVTTDLREITARIASKTDEIELFNRARRAAARRADHQEA